MYMKGGGTLEFAAKKFFKIHKGATSADVGIWPKMTLNYRMVMEKYPN
jgi:hypothetical protein